MQRIRHANIQHDVGSNIYSIFNEIGRREEDGNKRLYVRRNKKTK